MDTKTYITKINDKEAEALASNAKAGSPPKKQNKIMYLYLYWTINAAVGEEIWAIIRTCDSYSWKLNHTRFQSPSNLLALMMLLSKIWLKTTMTEKKTTSTKPRQQPYDFNSYCVCYYRDNIRGCLTVRRTQAKIKNFALQHGVLFKNRFFFFSFLFKQNVK